MSLYNLIYVSTAAADLNQFDLAEIAIQSSTNNQKVDVTGMLLYAKGSFIQVLEGPRDMVLERFAIIATDPRHGNIQHILDGPLHKRHFSNWSMGFRHVQPPVNWRSAESDYFWLTQKGFDAALFQTKPGLAMQLLLDYSRK
ncbi:BLUF domain-containing protein [Limnobacter litoralis]|uniref:BLUF domain-containing protein n=1 Tax=Limnobacter litoralis TaxID=481366 RepID=A0ABQ5YKY0_9BURK|nr:BLUF domain-containing protein [Limnobacter litoralis]GLR25209.1 hypothetical protein GCM10007875_02970 [Limnobacter litoralis]